MQKKNQSILLAIIWFTIVTFLLCIPGKKLPQIRWIGLFQVDKIIHIFLFFVLTMLLCKASYQVNKTQQWFWLIMFCCCLYGVSMEFVQEKYISNRSFDKWDIVADIIGSFSFLVYLNLNPKYFKN